MLPGARILQAPRAGAVCDPTTPSGSRLGKALPERVANVGKNRFEGFPRMDVELAVELCAMSFDRSDGYARTLRNLGVGERLEDVDEDSDLVFGETFRPFDDPFFTGTEPTKAVAMESPIDRGDEFVFVDGFHKKVERSRLETRNRHVHVRVTRKENDRQTAPDFAEAVLQFEPAHPRHPHVEHETPRAFFAGIFGVREEGVGARPVLDVKTLDFEHRLQGAPYGLVVVNDANERCGALLLASVGKVRVEKRFQKLGRERCGSGHGGSVLRA